MPRVDELTWSLDTLPRAGTSLPPVNPAPADELYKAGKQHRAGSEVAAAYGFLLHYTSVDKLGQILAAGSIGKGRYGCWLSPSPYSACMVPYNLGLRSPRDICLVLDISRVQRLWGPGTARPSDICPSVWWGGGVEFYTPDPIGIDALVELIAIEPCGDRHSER